MRVVVTANGSRGDVQPMLVLAATLQRRGHRVTVCATPSFAADARARGLAFVDAGLDLRQALQAQADVHTGSFKLLVHSWRLSHAELRSQFAGVRDAAGDADLIVSGGSQFAGGSIAAHRGVPHVVIAYAPAAFRSDAHGPTLVTRVGLPRWINRASWRIYDALAMAMVGRTINAERAALELPPIRNVHREAFAPDHALLAADPELCPLPADLAARCAQTAAIVAPDDGALPAEVEAFLAAGPPPVYVGFGSMVDQDAARTTRTLLAALRDVGARAILSRGWAALGDGAHRVESETSRGDSLAARRIQRNEERADHSVALPASCLLVDETPHRALFPRVAAVVHHGGAGTTAVAARAGVPQILVPHIADQFYFAHRAAKLGIAPPAIARGALTTPRLTQALAAVLGQGALRGAAAALAQRLARHDGADATAAYLEQVGDRVRTARAS